MGERTVLATTAADLARCVLAQGRDAEAASLCAESERLAAPEDVATGALWRGVRARLLAAAGEHAAAEGLAREAVALVEPTDLLTDRATVLLDLAEVLLAGGRADDAGRIRERAVALHEEKGNRVAAARARGMAGATRSGMTTDRRRTTCHARRSTRRRSCRTSSGSTSRSWGRC